MKLQILKGDNIELLKQYSDNYFDSVVTDCPYGLGKEPNALKLLQDWIDHGYHEIKGKGFMGKSWDAFVPQPLFWKEVFRVLKPGGYVLAFFGTRTYDWGTMAIRLAGFEIRDMICWHYGSGFPKSLNISKQLDKNAGVERKVVGKKIRGDVEIAKTKGSTFSTADANKNNKAIFGYGIEYITEATTDDAKQYEGWGTALKPATEPICVARKPLCGTVAENVLKYGTGGINIDGCRIEFESDEDLQSATYGTGTNIIGGNYVGSKLTDGRKNIEANRLGRFPSNVILDDYMGDILNEQSGELTSGKPCGIRAAKETGIYGKFAGGMAVTGFGDTGGASRFFYCAKASQWERNAGCDLLEAKKAWVGALRDGERESELRTNTHSTVKPISLIRYLQRLVTPKGGITLDPFAGSGTAGCSAYFENIGECVLMEIDDDGTYIPIIEARTKYWAKEINRNNYLEDIRVEKVEPVKNQISLF